MVVLAVLMGISGIVCNAVSTNMNNSDYETLISTSTASSLVEKINNYKSAIELYPARTDAYIKMIEAYQDEGTFSKQQNDEFLAVYNANKDQLDVTSTDVAELNYMIGMLYFNYYTENESGDYSFSTRVQKAYPFFDENFKNATGFNEQTMSDCYYRICSFYKKYILNTTTVEEASKENYDEILNTINSAMNDVKSAGAYDQLTLYNSVFMLLYDQRVSMAQVNVDKEQILDLYDSIYDRVKELTVQKEQSKKLQNEILDKYETYKQAIDRAYTNMEERK